MKTISSLLLSLTLAAGAFAGTPAAYNDKNPVGPPPEQPCFGPGFDIGVFGGGFLPRTKTDGYTSALGGGVLAEYFFNEYFGIQGSYGAYSTSGTQHLFNGDLILRCPIHSICLAPYLMLGGGFHVDGTSVGEYHAGGGLEYRFSPKVGIFTDGAYYLHGSGDRYRDFTLVRLGLKFGF